MKDYSLTFKRRVLSSVGDLFPPYSGNGSLVFRNGWTAECSFQAGQLRNGDVFVICDFPDVSGFAVGEDVCRLDGECLKEARVIANQGMMTAGRSSFGSVTGRSSDIWAVFWFRDLVFQPPATAQARNVRFGITNLELPEPVVTPSRSSLQLSLREGTRTTNVRIIPVEHYDEALVRMRIPKSVDVTCEVEVPLPEDGGTAQAIELVDRLCYILSVARGTKVQWVYYSEHAENDELLTRRHCSRVTRPYTPAEIIGLGAPGTGQLKSFVEFVYPVFSERVRSWPRLTAAIDAYLDAKSDVDFLEMRGAKLAVALEALKAALLDMPHGQTREFIIDEFRFENCLVAPLIDAIDTVLQSHGIHRDSRQQLCNRGKMKDLNRTSFRSLLKCLCNHIGLEIDKEGLDLLIKSRNSLIHRGQFYCNAADKEEAEECPPPGSEYEEYCFLVDFLNKVFLKLLGYSGPYLNWRSPGAPMVEVLR
ncbi:MAG TPA: hypothetical protein GXX51_11050 [Firmicutes bacterium]|nr:hypothetical protein [Bacillota bacterium]